MFKKIREKRYITKYIRVPLNDLFQDLFLLRQKTDILVLCPTVTGANWQGIYNATHSLFFENIFSIPQYYSNSAYSVKELKELSNIINELYFKKVIFSGFPDYFNMLSTFINGIEKCVIFHGSLSELSMNNNSLSLILESAHSNKIAKIGFVKKGLCEYFNQSSNLNCFYLPLKTILPDYIETPLLQNPINIGVFGNSGFNKNIHNQVAAALLETDATVHTICEADFSYLDRNDRIITHGNLERRNFLGLMAAMTINSHISFSESWGQIVTESLAMGVPCLTSNNNGIFDYDDYLADKLIVNQYDNPIAIAEQMKNVIENRDEISSRCMTYIEKLNKIADIKLKEFLSA